MPVGPQAPFCQGSETAQRAEHLSVDNGRLAEGDQCLHLPAEVPAHACSHAARRSGPSAHACFLETQPAGLGQWVGRGAGWFSCGAAGPSRGSGWIPAQARSEAGRHCDHGCGAKQLGFAASADPPVSSEAREPGPSCRACSRIRVMLPASLRGPARPGPRSGGRRERSALAGVQAGRCE